MWLIHSIAHVLWVVGKVIVYSSIFCSAVIFLLLTAEYLRFKIKMAWAKWLWNRAARKRIEIELLLLQNPFRKPERILREEEKLK